MAGERLGDVISDDGDGSRDEVRQQADLHVDVTDVHALSVVGVVVLPREEFVEPGVERAFEAFDLVLVLEVHLSSGVEVERVVEGGDDGVEVGFDDGEGLGHPASVFGGEADDLFDFFDEVHVTSREICESPGL